MILMILNKVSITNYRQYRDVVIDIASDPNNNFTIIKGNNGTGKTTLLNALTWCLYGTEIHSYGQYTAMDICNNKSVKLAEDNENIDVCVEMEFINDRGELLTFKRNKVFYKSEGNLRERISGNKFVVIKQEGDDFKIYEEDHHTVKKTIPKQVEEYFFFDGARLGQYFQRTSKKNIKDSVFNLSQLNLVERVSGNLTKVIDQYTSKQKKINPAVGSVNEKINACEIAKTEYEQKIKEAEEEINEHELEIEDITKQLVQMGSVDVKNAVKDEKRLEREISSLQNKLIGSDGDGGKIGERRNLILKTYPYLKSYKSFLRFLELGEDSRKKKYIPPKFKRSFLEDMLKEGVCICGTNLDEDEEHKQRIIDLLNETNPLTDESEKITSDLDHVKQVILRRVSNFREDSLKINSEIKYLNDSIKEKNDELKNVRAILENNSIEEIKSMEAIKQDLKLRVKTLSNKIISYHTEIRILEDEKARLETTARKQKKNSEKIALFDRKIEFCRDAEKAAQYIKNTCTNNMRKEIQKLTKEKFLQVQWKENEFIDLSIDGQYEISILNRAGNIEKPGDLSDGEKLILGLCFMSALHKISGFNLPIVMDTPLGVLDDDFRENFAKFLPKFVEGKQIIMLVTGTEYTDEFRDVLYDSVGKEYVIKWSNSEEGKESEVVLNG